MKKLFIFLVLTTCIILTINAQLKVFTNGNVGIDATNPVSRFSIASDGNTSAKAFIYNSSTAPSSRALQTYQKPAASGWCYGLMSLIENGSGGSKLVGIYGSSYRGSTATNDRNYGVCAYAGNGVNGYNYAVRAQLQGGRNGAAIFAITTGDDVDVADKYAGYFVGKVKIVGDAWANSWNLNSDSRLKKDLRNLDSDNIAKLMQIQGVKYKLKHPSERDDFYLTISDTANIELLKSNIDSPEFTKDRIGLIAQDIQKIFPELVEADGNGYLGLDYMGLIPVLVEAIKELQAEIEILQNEITLLKSKP